MSTFLILFFLLLLGILEMKTSTENVPDVTNETVDDDIFGQAPFNLPHEKIKKTGGKA